MPLDVFCLIWFCIVPHSALPPPQVPTAAFDASAALPDLPISGVSPVLAVLPSVGSPPDRTSGVDWTGVAKSSVRFLGVMHAFRWATEPDTRAGGVGLGSLYLRSVTNLHGWADGDPFYVNFLGHPAQGSISARLFLSHDRRFRNTEFGKSPEYWKGRLRAAAFSWAFSEQFEIGPLSEASIGRVQAHFPQQGFVDHVVTPSVGMGLTVLEDAVDKYAIKRLEGRIQNKWARLILRAGLNPTRSFANVMDGNAPWHRDTRAGVERYQPVLTERHRDPAVSPSLPQAAPFEFSVMPSFRQFSGGSCMGGGAEAAYRVAPEWQMVLDVNGCKLMGLETNRSGDALLYQVGPRWTPVPAGKWSPYAHVLVGGMKITHEQLFPSRKILVEQENQGSDPMYSYKLHDQYTTSEEADGFAFSAGTGVDYRLNNALAIRVAGVEYSRSTIANLGGLSYGHGLQVSTGMVLRLGTW